MSEYTELSNDEMITIAYAATKKFKGNMHELERAIGCLIVGQKVGWKVMLLVHDKKTLRKYEEYLGLNFREVMPELGPWKKKSRAWVAVDKLGNFWKAVRGEIAGVRTPELE